MAARPPMRHREEALMRTTDRHDGSCPACETDVWVDLTPTFPDAPETTPPLSRDGGEPTERTTR